MEKKEISVLEKNLTLVVKEQSLGKLITNAKEIQSFVSEKLKEYTPENYKGDEKQAEKDKAELNKAILQLNNERIRLETEFNKPFNEFKTIVNDTCNMIKTASNQLKTLVDARENQRKEEKRAEIENYFKTLNFSLISLNKIFVTKWLNKTYKMKDIEAEIKNKIEEIQTNIKYIETNYHEFELYLKNLYLTNLNSQDIDSMAQKLYETNKKVEEEKKENQQVEIKIDPNKNKVIENKPTQTISKPTQKKDEFKFMFTTPLTRMAENCGLQVSINVNGTIAQCKDFRSMLEKNGYEYEKCHNEEGTLILIIKEKSKEAPKNKDQVIY